MQLGVVKEGGGFSFLVEIFGKLEVELSVNCGFIADSAF